MVSTSKLLFARYKIKRCFNGTVITFSTSTGWKKFPYSLSHKFISRSTRFLSNFKLNNDTFRYGKNFCDKYGHDHNSDGKLILICLLQILWIHKIQSGANEVKVRVSKIERQEWLLEINVRLLAQGNLSSCYEFRCGCYDNDNSCLERCKLHGISGLVTYLYIHGGF